MRGILFYLSRHVDFNTSSVKTTADLSEKDDEITKWTLNVLPILFRVKPGFIGRQGSSDRSFYVSFTALPTDTCSERSYPFVFATNLLSDTALKICIARVITP